MTHVAVQGLQQACCAQRCPNPESCLNLQREKAMVRVRGLRGVSVGLLLLAACVPHVQSMDMYCGEEDCYTILGVEPDAPRNKIKRAYFKLSLK